MYQPPKCPYSYFSSALDFYLRVLFPCEYPQWNVTCEKFFFRKLAENEAGRLVRDPFSFL